MPSAGPGGQGQQGLLSPPALHRNNSSTSTRSSRSVHSQRAHRSHYSLDDPSASIVSNAMAPTNPQAHHLHAQHGDVFVPVHGGNLMPDFDSLVAAEQRELMEDDLEDAEAEADERSRLLGSRPVASERRKSVAFDPQSGIDKAGRTNGYSSIDANPHKSTAGTAFEFVANNASQGTVGDRLKWRRAGLNWLIPVVTCFALCMGMGSAPKQELLINLTCLSHPPQTQTTDRHLVQDPEMNMSMAHVIRAMWEAPSIPRKQLDAFYAAQEDAMTQDVDDFIGSALTKNQTEPPVLPPLTPADKWMIELQKRIAEDRTRQEAARRRPARGGKSPSPQEGGEDGLPGGEIPHRPIEGGHQDGEEGPRRDGGKDGGRNEGPGDAPRPAIDPRLCKKSPRTQAATATLTMTMTLCMGILSAMTTGFWGAVSDRLGRTKVMSIAVLGLVASDVILIITATYPHKVPGGYRFLLVGPVLDGLLGGFSTMMATNNAYLSDVTPDGSRAKSFGRVQGIMMFGFSMGPILGSALIRATGDIMSVFYLAVIFNTCLVFFIAFVLPESLTHEARHALEEAVYAKKLKAATRDAAERAWEESDEPDANASGWSRISGFTAKSSRTKKRFHGRMNRLRRRMFAFLSPIRLFIPKGKVVEEGGRVLVKKDYNLLLLVTAMFFITSVMALMQIKGQFLIFRYGWSSAELGPYLTLMAGTRGFVLLVFMPLVVRLFKPIVKPDPSRSDADVAAMQAIADTRFDLSVIRYSLFIDIISYAAMSVLVPAPVFVLLTCLVTFGSCTSPASNSLALNLIDSARDSGKLFAGLAVCGALSSTFVGPILFATTFAHTVGTYAPTVFAVAAGIIMIAQVILIFVKLPGFPHEEDNERGRDRGVKRVESSSSTAGSSHRGSM